MAETLKSYVEAFADREARPLAVVLGAEHYNALAVIRALGLQGVPVIAAGNRAGVGGQLSRFAGERLTYPDFNEDEDGALQAIVELCRQCRGRGQEPLLFPTGDRHVEFLMTHRETLQPLARLHLPEDPILDAVMDKGAQYRLADKLGIPFPRSWTNEELEGLKRSLERRDVDFPLIFKARTVLPEYHQNEKFRRVPLRDLEMLTVLVDEAKNLELEFVVQEIIPGADDQLFTLGAMMTAGGRLSGIFTGRKLRQMPPGFGVCRAGENCEIDEIVEHGERLLKAFGFFGISQVEFKYDARDDQFKLMEINPRSWSWIGLSTRVGVNLPYLYFLDAFGIDVTDAERSGNERVLWISVWDDLFHSLKHRDQFPLKNLFDGYSGFQEAYFEWGDPKPALRYAGPMFRQIVRMLGGRLLRKVGLRRHS